MPPQTSPPFIPDEFDLGSILESGLGQVALPLLLGGASAFGQTGARVGQGVASGLELAQQINQQRIQRQQRQALGQQLRNVQFPGSATGAAQARTSQTPQATGTGAGAGTTMGSGATMPTSTAQTPGASPTQAGGAGGMQGGMGTQGAGTRPAVTSPPISPSGQGGSSSNFDLGALLEAAAQTGSIDDVIDMMTVFKPASAKPLDPVTAELRRAQADHARSGIGLREQQAELARARQATEAARAQRLKRLGATNAGPYLGQNRLSVMIQRNLDRLREMLPEDPGYDELVEETRQLQELFRDALPQRGRIRTRQPEEPTPVDPGNRPSLEELLGP